MLFSKLAFVSALAVLTAAQDTTTNIDLSNIPAECTDTCTQVIAIVNGCNTDNNNDDAARLQCICTANSANTLIPGCQSCIIQFNGDTDNNIQDLMNTCNYPTTAGAPAATSTGVVGGGVGGVGGAGATAAQTTAVDTITSVVSETSVAIIISSTGSMSGSMSRSMSGSMASGSGGAGASQTAGAAPMKTAGAAMGIGALGFAMGLL